MNSSLPIKDTNFLDNSVMADDSFVQEDFAKIGEPMENGKVAEDIYSIKKNEIFVHNMRFKATSSFLLLVRILYETHNIATKFKSIGPEAISKIFEIIKVKII